jgi:hypothetical protein
VTQKTISALMIILAAGLPNECNLIIATNTDSPDSISSEVAAVEKLTTRKSEQLSTDLMTKRQLCGFLSKTEHWLTASKRKLYKRDYFWDKFYNAYKLYYQELVIDRVDYSIVKGYIYNKKGWTSSDSPIPQKLDRVALRYPALWTNGRQISNSTPNIDSARNRQFDDKHDFLYQPVLSELTLVDSEIDGPVLPASRWYYSVMGHFMDKPILGQARPEKLPDGMFHSVRPLIPKNWPGEYYPPYHSKWQIPFMISNTNAPLPSKHDEFFVNANERDVKVFALKNSMVIASPKFGVVAVPRSGFQSAEFIRCR